MNLAQHRTAWAGTDQGWVQVAHGAPYFMTEDGRPWHPIGQNDAITWPELDGLFRRKDLPGVDRHLGWLASQGVTCLRVMMEYSQVRHRYLEKPVGRFVPAMVQLWDDLFDLCDRHGLRLLLTPFDTFWMWLHWRHHPYSRANGGPCARPADWLTDRGMIEAVKARLSFMVTRWGGRGTVFAWDLWNEMHPAHMGGDPAHFGPVVDELSEHVRRLEERLHGRSHPQTVSLFGPILDSHPVVADTIFRHPRLDFASTHLYAEGSIDHPRDTVAPALKVGELVREALGHLPPARPYFDSEHGPIHSFKDKKKTLPEAFDDEYFRHIQWAHLASGAAGGGMRWPNRRPHVLTTGMRRAQSGLAGFLPLIDWGRFHRRNLNAEVRTEGPVHVFACGDDRQALAWLLRNDGVDPATGCLRNDIAPAAVQLGVPGLADGPYDIGIWNTREGALERHQQARSRGGHLHIVLPAVGPDVALAIRPAR
jgi:mannan endo-1,4-beta-mannosidase